MQLGISLALTLVTQFAWALNPTPPITERLLHSAWEGTFTALEGVSTPIRLVFLPELNAMGALQYFHRFPGTVSSEVLQANKACQFTPRALSVQSVSESVGRIFIFECVDNEDVEMQLEGDRNRKHLPPSFDVSELSLSPDGSSLLIVAHAAATTLIYHLQRQRLPSEIPSRQELRSWLNE